MATEVFSTFDYTIDGNNYDKIETLVGPNAISRHFKIDSRLVNIHRSTAQTNYVTIQLRVKIDTQALKTFLLHYLTGLVLTLRIFAAAQSSGERLIPVPRVLKIE